MGCISRPKFGAMAGCMAACLCVVGLLRPILAVELPPAAAAALAAALQKPTPLEFAHSKLGDLVGWLQEKQGLKVLLDEPALQAAEIPADSPLDIQVKHLPLKAGLRLALEPLSLDFVVRDDVLMITTSDKAAASVYPVVYPVGDLLPKGGVPGNPE